MADSINFILIAFILGIVVGVVAVSIDSDQFEPVYLVENGTTIYYSDAWYDEHYGLGSNSAYADIVIRENGTFSHKSLGPLGAINGVSSFFSDGVRIVIVPEVI